MLNNGNYLSPGIAASHLLSVLPWTLSWVTCALSRERCCGFTSSGFDPKEVTVALLLRTLRALGFKAAFLLPVSTPTLTFGFIAVVVKNSFEGFFVHVFDFFPVSVTIFVTEGFLLNVPV